MNQVLGHYEVTRCRAKDLPFLAGIELAAAKLLAGKAPESVLMETTSHDALQEALTRGHLWVALKNDIPVGFAHVELLEPGVAHLKEIDVHPGHGRKGIGTCLIAELCDWAARRGYQAITLTTFRDVPWNMPFYERLGFRALLDEDLSPSLIGVLRDEAIRGLNLSNRVAMRRSLNSSALTFAKLS